MSERDGEATGADVCPGDPGIAVRQEDHLRWGALDDLLALIHSLPIPLARPDPPRADESLGLTILSLALRLPHITRTAENLQFLNLYELKRSIAMDIDLRQMTADERKSLEVRCYDGAGRDRTPFLWVPISRFGRDVLEPVPVRDASGSVIPHLTQRATSGATAAGLVGLFRILALRVKAPSETPCNAQWLIERAIEQLILLGRQGVPWSSRVQAQRSEGAHDRETRSYAEALARLVAEHSSGFPELLQLASEEYFLVVMLPEDPAQAHVRFEAPLSPGEDKPYDVEVGAPPGWHRGLVWRALRNVLRVRDARRYGGDDFHLQYSTQLPSSLASYHVTVEVAEDIMIRRFLLTSDAELVPMKALLGDMCALAVRTQNEQLCTPSDSTIHEVLRIELPRILAALADLGRRRTYDLRAYDDYLSGEGFQDAWVHRRDAVEPFGADEALLALAEGRCSLKVLNGLADMEACGQLNDCMFDLPQRASIAREIASALPHVIEDLRKRDLYLDVHAETHQGHGVGHAQWRNRAAPSTGAAPEPINVTTVYALSDEEPALIDTVKRMVGALLVVVVGVALLVAPPLAGTQAAQSDAIVAVLLIVPGILLARLSTGKYSVLGVMQAGARRLAYVSVGSVSLLAVVVAASSDRRIQSASALLTGLLLSLVLLTIGANLRRRNASRHSRVVSAAAVPRWLAEAFPGRSAPRVPDVRFGARAYRIGGHDPDFALASRLAQRGAYVLGDTRAEAFLEPDDER